MAMLDVANHWRSPTGELADIAGLDPARSRSGPFNPAATHPAGPRRASPPGVGDDRYCRISRRMDQRPRHIFVEYRHVARLPLRLQLVRQADVWAALHGPVPEDVALEMLRIKQEVAPDHLWFTDDILGLDVDWIDAFADEVERTSAAIPFTMQSRVNLMSDRSVRRIASGRRKRGLAGDRIRVSAHPRRDGQGHHGRGGAVGNAAAQGARHQGLLVHPARLPVRDPGRTSSLPAT